MRSRKFRILRRILSILGRKSSASNPNDINDEELRIHQMLSYSTSDEVRAYVNEILGQNAMLLKGCKDPNLVEYAKNIRREARGLLTLMNDIKEFSKIEADKAELLNVDYNLFDLLNECNDLCENDARKKNVKLIFNVEPTIPQELEGDEFCIRRIIHNLLFNALKYIKVGEVMLEVDYERRVKSDSSDESYINLKLLITDTGDGIPQEAMADLFDLSKRLRSGWHNIASTDLSLNLIKRMAELMDGSLKLESSFGRGTTIQVVIPQKVKKEILLGDYSARRRQYLASRETDLHNFRAPHSRILFADSVPMNLRVIKGLLKESEIKMDDASSGIEALDKIKNQKYNLILLDSDLPIMNAFEVMEVVKTIHDNANENTPVILMNDAGILDPQNVHFFAECVHKPIAENVLYGILIKYLLPKKGNDFTLIDENAEESGEASSDEALIDGNEDGSVFGKKPVIVESKQYFDLQVHPYLLNLIKSKVIDVYVGMNFCEGEESLYHSLLVDFRNNDCSAVLQQSAEIDDYEKYRLVLMELKKKAFAIGAIGMASLAKTLEIACAEGHYELVTANHFSLMHEYKNLLKVLNENV